LTYFSLLLQIVFYSATGQHQKSLFIQFDITSIVQKIEQLSAVYAAIK